MKFCWQEGRDELGDQPALSALPAMPSPGLVTTLYHWGYWWKTEPQGKVPAATNCQAECVEGLTKA